MFTQTFPINTATLLHSFADQDFIQPFYLTDSTALALELDHRESEDLDFFNQSNFEPLSLLQ